MNIADLATANAISLEAKKDGLTQRQSGDWRLSLTIAAVDMDQRITSAPMGTRFAVVLVEITDDETPRDHRSEERDKWRDLGPSKQAGIRCKEPIFWAFLREKHACDCYSEDRAAHFVRVYCNVETRGDLGKPGMSEHRTLWHTLDFEYQAWKAADARS